MILDRYSWQTKAIFTGTVVVAIVLLVLLVRHEDSRARDLELASQAKVLAIALEKYYAIYRSYPDLEKLTLDKLKIISEKGVNKDGNQIFYRNTVVWPEHATLAIQSDDYQLDFTVYNSWPAWGVTKSKGGRCRFMQAAKFVCADWAK